MKVSFVVRGRHSLAQCCQPLCAVLAVSTLMLMSSVGWADEEEAVLEQCDAPKGTIAVSEPQSHVVMALSRYNLPPPTSLLRQYIQNSNCFQVVERGRAMRNIQQERGLAESGMLQQDSNMGGGQMVTADFVMTPDVIFKDDNAGGAGVGAAVGSLFGGIGSLVGAVAGGVKFQEAQTTLTMADTRSSLQVAAASGTYKKADWAFGGVLGAIGGGAYTSTDEGKIVAAALLDNYNNIVRDVRSNPSLLESTSAVAQQNAAASLQAVNHRPGAVLSAKLDNVKVLDEPDRGAEVVSKLKKGEEVVFMGDAEDGYLYVQGSEAEGWVQEFMLDG